MYNNTVYNNTVYNIIRMALMEIQCKSYRARASTARTLARREPTPRRDNFIAVIKVPGRRGYFLLQPPDRLYLFVLFARHVLGPRKSARRDDLSRARNRTGQSYRAPVMYIIFMYYDKTSE